MLDRFYRMHWPFSWDSPRLHFHCRSPSTATKVIGSTHCSRSVFQCLFCVCVSFSAVDGHVYDGVRRSTKNVSYFLFVIFLQLTATLRNIADVSGTRRYFLALGLVSELCRLMKLSKFDPDLMLNISRIFRCVHVCMCTCVCVFICGYVSVCVHLCSCMCSSSHIDFTVIFEMLVLFSLSKLTPHTDVCTAITEDSSNFGSFLELLQKHRHNEVGRYFIDFIAMLQPLAKRLRRLRYPPVSKEKKKTWRASNLE